MSTKERRWAEQHRPMTEREFKEFASAYVIGVCEIFRPPTKEERDNHRGLKKQKVADGLLLRVVRGNRERGIYGIYFEKTTHEFMVAPQEGPIKW